MMKKFFVALAALVAIGASVTVAQASGFYPTYPTLWAWKRAGSSYYYPGYPGPTVGIGGSYAGAGPGTTTGAGLGACLAALSYKHLRKGVAVPVACAGFLGGAVGYWMFDRPRPPQPVVIQYLTDPPRANCSRGCPPPLR